MAVADRHEAARRQRQAQADAERAAWPDQYATVREALTLGFLPDAYGNVDGQDGRLYRPPTRYWHPAGGLAHPFHVHGAVGGSRLICFSHADGSPDELRDQPVWAAGAAWDQLGGLYTTRWGLTLPEGLARCIAAAAHIRRHFLVPAWEEGDCIMPARHWRELQGLRAVAPGEPSSAQQLDLFGPVPAPNPRDPQAAVWEAVWSLPAAAPDDQLWRLPYGRATFEVAHLIDRANRRRKDAGVPPLASEWMEDAA